MADYESINPPPSDHRPRGSKNRSKGAPQRHHMRDINTGEWIEMVRREEQQVPRQTFFYDTNGNRYRFIDLGKVVAAPEEE